VKKTGFLRG